MHFCSKASHRQLAEHRFANSPKAYRPRDATSFLIGRFPNVGRSRPGPTTLAQTGANWAKVRHCGHRLAARQQNTRRHTGIARGHATCAQESVRRREKYEQLSAHDATPMALWGNIGNGGPTLATSGPCLADFGQVRVHFGSTLANFEPALTAFGPRSADSGPSLGVPFFTVGRSQAIPGRSWSHSGRMRSFPSRICPELVDLGPKSSEFGQHLVVSGPIWPMLAESVPKSGHTHGPRSIEFYRFGPKVGPKLAWLHRVWGDVDQRWPVLGKHRPTISQVARTVLRKSQ